MHSDIGYVLHRRRYRESSLIVEFLTHDHGRVGAVARGALRRHSPLAAILQPLIPLTLTLAGRSDLLTLTRAEVDGARMTVQGERLYCLLYVNELIMRLTAAHDPNVQLFDLYRATLTALAGAPALESALRRFEIRLLETLGLGLNLAVEADSGRAVDAAQDYRYVLERGPVRASTEAVGLQIGGATLLAIIEERELNADARRQAKALMRYVLNHHLDGRPLASRKLFEAPASRNS
jgi:DNA repair protein RecO (recombination protein O)